MVIPLLSLLVRLFQLGLPRKAQVFDDDLMGVRFALGDDDENG